MLWKPSGENTTVGNMALTQDFKKFVALLDENDEITAHVIDLYSLKQNKKATGRPQDVADLLNLT